MPNPLQPFDTADFIRGATRTIDGIQRTRASGAGNSVAEPFAMYPAPSASFLATTSGSFTTLWRGQGQRIFPYITVAGWMVADASTAGELRLMVDGSTQVGATIAVPASVVTYWEILRQPWPAGAWITLDVEIQARRVSGAGSVYVGMQHSRSENTDTP